MKCPKCSAEMIIDHAEYRATGDNSPTAKTMLYSVPFYKCIDEKCKFADVVEGEPIPLAPITGGDAIV